MSLDKNLDLFWWVAAESHELQNKPLARKILDKDIVLFRGEDGHPVALKDQCIHRGAALSSGTIQKGQLTCPYHGWRYNQSGDVTWIPSEGRAPKGRRCQREYQAIEQDGFVYVRFSQKKTNAQPFPMPHYKDKGYSSIRLQNLFEAELLNCVENFIDIPHTTFVHPNIFRNESGCETKTKITKRTGHVHIEYFNENSDFGWFSWFLNPKKMPVVHTDEYFGPNITTVNYYVEKGHFIITSQSVPIDEDHTLVYTDLTYNYGIWNYFCRPIVRSQSQKVIDQDVIILKNQHQTLKRNPMRFQNSDCDLIHLAVDQTYHELVDPKNAPTNEEKVTECSFWI